jgi:peptide/nickel transport system substrate-binding protein
MKLQNVRLRRRNNFRRRREWAAPRRRHTSTWQLRAAPLVGLLLILASCSSDDPGEADTEDVGAADEAPSDDQPNDSTVRIGVLTEPNSMDPHDVFRGNWNVRGNIYETLIDYDERLEPVPVLAESWDVAEDNTAITLTLRSDVSFHGGTPLTAAAVVANFEKVRDPETGYATASRVEFVDSTTAVDEQTLEISFTQPLSERMVFDILQSVQIVDPEVFESLDREASGTGPFALQEWRSGESLILVRNDQYWGSSAKPNQLEFRLFDDSDARLAALQTGEVDIVWDLGNPREIERLGDDFEVVPEAPNCTIQFAMNTRRPPFDDENVRRAFQHVVDRQAIATSVLAGYSEPRVLPWSPQSLAYDEQSIHEYPFDLDRARTMLDEAGAFPIQAELLVFDIVPWFADIGQVLEASLREIDVELRLSVVPIAEVGPRLIENKDFDAYFNYVCDMNLFPTIAAGDRSIGKANNSLLYDEDHPIAAEWTAARELMVAAVEEADLMAAAAEMNRVLLERSWVLHIGSVPSLHVVRAGVTGFGFTAASMPLYADVELGAS